ncbi:carboxylesterase family protein [Hugenholtzia roseola]|uniref:carboxylesterase family protein n=1 Tax=Hugenholtzia roseola TaxID=1002 RepID=UPI00047BE34F|nr:carboxylesterase family protein [Hugenholtzia roseola]
MKQYLPRFTNAFSHFSRRQPLFGHLFLLCLLSLWAKEAQAQLPNRYLEEVFPTTTLIPNVRFGTNIPKVRTTPQLNPFAPFFAPTASIVTPNEGDMATQQQNLDMDIYLPTGDTLTKRPVIIICFGGGFVAGSRADTDIQRYAERLARRGFVTAAIDYRLGMNILNADASYRGVYRGVQDGRQAVRFFRANAATYGIDPDQVFIAGHSAGGFVALHNIHLDKVGEIPVQTQAVPSGTYGNSNNWPSLGGLDGVGQNQTQNGKANMAFAWAGALGFLSYVEGADDAPACMFHSVDDGTVPYSSGEPFPDFAFITDLPVVYGSGTIHPYAQGVGAPTTLHDTTGLDHNPHLSTTANEILVRNRMGECSYEYRLKPFEVQIVGDDQVCFSSTNPALNIRTYTLSNTDNYHYEWQVVGGTFVTPPTVFSTSVQVQWNSAGTHSLSVRPFQRNLARNKTLITRTVTVTAPSNPPPITCPANVSANADAGLCSANLTLTAPTVDGCAVSLVNDFNNTADASGVYPVGTTAVVWTVTDINGNINTCTQTVTVVDAQNPTAVCQNLNLNLDASGSLTFSATDFNNGSADNCLIASILFDDTGLATKTFDCSQIGTNTVTIRVTDAAGNSSTCTATLTVVDNLTPTPLCQNLSLNLDASGSLTVSASDFNNGSSDNCGIISILFDDTGTATKTFDCGDVGAHNPVIRFTDAAGNSNTCTATLNVLDFTLPTALCQNLSLNLDASGSLTVSASDFNNGSNDNCGIASILFDDTAAATKTFTCATAGVQNLVIRITDTNGNVSTCSATLTVADNTLPTAVCQNLSLNLDATGSLTVSASDFNNGSSDNCGIASIVFTDTGLTTKTFSCADLGTQAVMISVTDTNGNVNACTTNAFVSANEFLVYSGAQFSENNANDGSIGNALNLTLAPCKEFAGADGTDLVATGAVTVLNLPAGLTAQIIKTSGTTATFSLVGNANPHTSAENVNDLTVTFLDAAFNGGNATTVSGSVRNDLQVLFLNSPLVGGGGFIPAPALTIPNQFRLVAVNTHSIALTWELSPQAQGYRLYRYSAANGWEVIAFLEADVSEYLDTDLQNDTEYRYRLEAYRGAETATANGREHTYPEMPLVEILRPACSNNPYVRLQAINRHTNPVFLWYDAPQGGNLLFKSLTTRIFEYPISSPTVFYVAAEGLKYESTERTRVEIIPQTAPMAQFLNLTSDLATQKAIYTCQNSRLLELLEPTNDLIQTYTWYRYGVQVAQTQTPEYLATESGIYTVRVENASGCFTVSDKVAVYLNYQPEAKILASAQVFFCRQGLLSAKSLPNATYRWFRNGESVAEGEVLTVSMAGNYTVEVSQYGCTQTSSVVEVVLGAFPEEIALSATDTQICQGSTTVLEVPAFPQTLYRWYRNGIFLTTTQVPTLEVGSEGVYTVELRSRAAGQNCAQFTSALALDVIAVEKARLLRIGSALKVETQGQVARVDWYFNGEMRSDLGNALEITPTQVGHYQAEVVYASNCATKTQRLFLTTGVTGEEQEPTENLALQIFPNPTQDLCHLVGLDKIFEKDLQVEIHDATGKVVWIQKYENVEPTLQIQTQSWANGSYFIVLSNAEKTVIRKLIKE